MKLVVYTAIFGDKDEAPTLLNPQHLDVPQVDFICITDNPDLKSAEYQIRVAPRTFSDMTKNARRVKIKGFDGMDKYDIAIWHDSSVMIDCRILSDLVSHGMQHELCTFVHGTGCVYKEARACIELEKDHPFRIMFQVIYYALWLKYPVRKGLFETTMLVINVKKYLVGDLPHTWWKHVRCLSRRDQLSLPVASWLTGRNLGILKGQGFKNDYSTYRGHRYDHYISSNRITNMNSRWMRKIALWVIYRIERRLSVIVVS